MKRFLFVTVVLLALCTVIASWFVPTDSMGLQYGATTAAAAALLKNFKFRRVLAIAYPGTTQDTRSPLPRTFVYKDLLLRLTGQVDVAIGGGADGVLTVEQPFNFFRNIRIEAASPLRPTIGQIKNFDGAAAYRLHHFLNGVGPGESVGLAIPGIQAATLIRFTTEIDFELTRSIEPRVSLLNSRELDALDLILTWGDATDINQGGNRVFTLTNFVTDVSAREFLDPATVASRYSIYRVSTIEQAVAAANTDLQVDLKRGFVMRGIFVKGYTQAAGVSPHTPVNTVIVGAQLRLNRDPKLDYVAAGMLRADNTNMFQLSGVDYAGAAVGAAGNPPAGYHMLELMPEGRSDTLIDTRVFEDVVLSLNVAAPANARFRLYPLELIPS